MDVNTNKLATLLRELPDDKLVQLAFSGGGAQPVIQPMRARAANGRSNGNGHAAAKPVVARAAKAKRTRASKEELEKIQEKVFQTIKENPGLSSTEIGKKAKVEANRVSASLSALKTAERIAQGGNLRWARYATTQTAADKASEAARSGGKDAD